MGGVTFDFGVCVMLSYFFPSQKRAREGPKKNSLGGEKWKK